MGPTTVIKRTLQTLSPRFQESLTSPSRLLSSGFCHHYTFSVTPAPYTWWKEEQCTIPPIELLQSFLSTVQESVQSQFRLSPPSRVDIYLVPRSTMSESCDIIIGLCVSRRSRALTSSPGDSLSERKTLSRILLSFSTPVVPRLTSP